MDLQSILQWLQTLTDFEGDIHGTIANEELLLRHKYKIPEYPKDGSSAITALFFIHYKLLPKHPLCKP